LERMLKPLCMPKEERRARMRSMRKTVERHNVYSWAGRILLDAAEVNRLRPA
jgi:trehalose 6-phosphate synthase